MMAEFIVGVLVGAALVKWGVPYLQKQGVVPTPKSGGGPGEEDPGPKP